MNKVDYDVAMEVASHEALVRQTYKDSVGVLTWDVGMTNATGHTVERYIGRPASVAHCMNIYAWALARYAAQVTEIMGPLPKHVYAGTVSFTWNLGAGSLRKAAWVKHYKAGRMADAERAFKLWNKAGGKVSAGLVARRAAEADLIFRGKWSNDGRMTEYTRVTSKMTPDWSSAKKIDVSKELRAAFIVPANVPIDIAPKPNEQGAPTKTPSHSPAGLLAVLVIGALVAAGAWVWGKFKGKQ